MTTDAQPKSGALGGVAGKCSHGGVVGQRGTKTALREKVKISWLLNIKNVKNVPCYYVDTRMGRRSRSRRGRPWHSGLDLLPGYAK